MIQTLSENIERLRRLSGTPLMEDDASKQNNFYLFRKDIKSLLTPFGLFADSIEIGQDTKIYIKFHPSSTSKYFGINQFYSIYYNDYTAFPDGEDILEMFDNKNLLKKLMLINGGNRSNFLLQMPTFTYVSPTFNTLPEVFSHFKKRLGILCYSNPNSVNFHRLETFMKEKFIETQKHLLNSITYGDDTKQFYPAFLLYNPQIKDTNIDVILDLSLDQATYMIVGNVTLDYDGSKYKYHFDDITQFKSIMTQAMEFLQISPATLGF